MANPTVPFRTWLREFTPEQKSDKAAVEEYVEKILKQRDKAIARAILTSVLTAEARNVIRAKTRSAERRATKLTHVKLDVFEKDLRDKGLDSSHLRAAHGGHTDAQKQSARKEGLLNLKAGLSARIELAAESRDLELTDDFLASQLAIGGKLVQWGKATYSELFARYEVMFNQTVSDTDTLITIKTALNRMEEHGKKKTLTQIRKLELAAR